MIDRSHWIVLHALHVTADAMRRQCLPNDFSNTTFLRSHLVQKLEVKMIRRSVSATAHSECSEKWIRSTTESITLHENINEFGSARSAHTPISSAIDTANCFCGILCIFRLFPPQFNANQFRVSGDLHLFMHQKEFCFCVRFFFSFCCCQFIAESVADVNNNDFQENDHFAVWELILFWLFAIHQCSCQQLNFPVLCDLAAVAIALFDNCDFIVQLRPNEGTYVVSPGGYLQILNYFGYIGYYEPGSSCRYSVQAPANYALKLDCTIDIAVTVWHGINVAPSHFHSISLWISVAESVQDMFHRKISRHNRWQQWHCARWNDLLWQRARQRAVAEKCHHIWWVVRSSNAEWFGYLCTRVFAR